MVAVTVLVAPSITDTVLLARVGHVDGVRGRVHPDRVRVAAHADGGGDGVGGPVDHRHGVAARCWPRRRCAWTGPPPPRSGCCRRRWWR